MRCCVPGCKNDSRHLSKSQGVTFHVFPTEPSVRTAWLQALGKVNWEPKERSAVCSEHFLFEDLYETPFGLRKVRGGAVPFIVQDSTTGDYGEPASLRVCRICLVMNRKLFPIRQYRLEQAYEHLTGLNLREEDTLPERLCYECAHRLLNNSKFRRKSLLAHALLTELVEKQGHLTTQNLRTINLENNVLTSTLVTKIFSPDHHNLYINTEKEETLIDYNKDFFITIGKPLASSHQMLTTQNLRTINLENNVLTSTLVTKIFSPDHHNLYINTEKEETLIDNNKEQVDDLNLDLEVKDESNNGNQIFINETDDLNNQADEIKDEIDIDNDGFVNDNHSHHSDVDFNVSDKEYSSDDSIPLERRRIKKHTRKKTAKQKTQKKDSVKKVRKKAANVSNEPKIDRRRKPFLNDDLNETLFTITNLTIEEQVAEIDKRQESANYKNAVFKCTECYKGFLDEDAYNGHMTRHTKQCGEHQCDVCKTHFKHPHALRKHITAHHTQRFSCNQCPYVTTHRQTARLHERWHKGTKYQCPHCQDEFVKFTTYMGHVRIKHPSDFVCQLCGFSFVSEKGIELHKKLKHRLEQAEIPEDGPFCELCNVRFVSPEAHRQHLRVSARHNTSDKDSREANKPKGRKTKDAKERERKAREKLEKEMGDNRRVYPSQMRKAEGPIPCEQCGLQLEDSRAYHSHFRRMHPDKNRTNYPSMKSPCMCEVCGRMFQSYALLKDHTWTHTGERPFKCDACGKAFRMKQRLVAHRRVHSQVKTSYVCNLCGKHFSTHSNRQRHMFIHTGLKPFKCEMCGKGFKHASEKRAHITYVHLKKPWPKRSRGKRRGDRQDSEPPEMHPASASEMDIAHPIWPPCDPKMDHMPPLIEDKAVYYNLKM